MTMSFLHDWVFPLCAATARISTPLIFAAIGGMFSERSGVINIALEGLMLCGAFGAAVTAYYFHSPWLGMLGGGFSGTLLAVVYAFFVIECESDQIVAGTGINILAAGIPPFIGKIIFDATGSTPELPQSSRFVGWQPVWLACMIVLAAWLWLRRSISGMWVQFAGEHPQALTAAGIRVRAVRWSAVLMSGLLAGMGGATLSIYLSSSYSRDMTAGRGFMALAALIFGKWEPIPALLACLFFGFTDALQARLQGVYFHGHEIPVQFIQILPYVVTILVLAGFVGASRPPSSLGKPIDT